MNSRPLPYQGSALPLSYKSDLFDGAGDEDRTRDMQLGRLPLYQLSYSRMLVLTTYIEVEWWWEKDSNLRNFRSRVTVCPLWPLGNLTTSHLHSAIPNFIHQHFKWCRHTDSNCGPTDYKSVALPTELCRLYLSV